MKVVTLSNLSTAVVTIMGRMRPTETNYYLEIQSGATYTVPNYSSAKSLLDVYVNGLRIVEGTDYTVNASGVVTLNLAITSSGNYLHIIHRRWN